MAQVAGGEQEATHACLRAVASVVVAIPLNPVVVAGLGPRLARRVGAGPMALGRIPRAGAPGVTHLVLSNSATTEEPGLEVSEMASVLYGPLA